MNSKGKKYLRVGIPGTGIYYQPSLPDAQPGNRLSPQPAFRRSLSLLCLLAVGFIIFAMSFSNSTKMTAPVAPVSQVVAPVMHKHVVKKHKRKHVAHRARTTTTKSQEAPAEESTKLDARGKGNPSDR